MIPSYRNGRLSGSSFGGLLAIVLVVLVLYLLLGPVRF